MASYWGVARRYYGGHTGMVDGMDPIRWSGGEITGGVEALDDIIIDNVEPTVFCVGAYEGRRSTKSGTNRTATTVDERLIKFFESTRRGGGRSKHNDVMSDDEPAEQDFPEDLDAPDQDFLEDTNAPEQDSSPEKEPIDTAADLLEVDTTTGEDFPEADLAADDLLEADLAADDLLEADLAAADLLEADLAAADFLEDL